ncbi:MAG TPA: hypothetical protein VF883_07465 [Thermoanaerobaculia bacterium]
MNPSRRNDVLALALLTAIITALFVDILAGVNCLYLRDIVHYAYPGKKVLRDVVLGGEFPYWNRAVSAGQPMAANPAHEAFYPLTWLILLPDFDYGFQLFILVHIYLAAFGMYAFLRSLGTGAPASFFGALSFALGGLVLSYAALLPLLAAIVWVPPTLLFARRFLLHGVRRDFALAAVFFALQLTVGEPTTVLQCGLLLGMYALASGWKRGRARGALRGVVIVGLLSVAALLVAAVTVLPMVDHARDSVRARALPYDTVVNWSTPPARFVELLYPNFFGHPMLKGRAVYWGGFLYPGRGGPFAPSIYPGVLITVLAMAGAFSRVRGVWLFLAVLVLSFLLALGENTPLYRFLYDVGVMRSIRYPEKYVFMTVLAVIVFAARTLDMILAGDERVRRRAMIVLGTTTALAAAMTLLATSPLHQYLFAAAWQPPADMFLEMLTVARSGWLLATVRGVLMIVLLRTLMRTRRAVWLGITTVFVVLDLATPMPELVRRTSTDYLNTPPLVLRQLPPNHDQYRMFHHGTWHRHRPHVKPFYRPRAEEWTIWRNAAVPLIPAAHGVQIVIDTDYDLTALLPTSDYVRSVWTLADTTPEWIEQAAWMSNIWYRALFKDFDAALAEAKGDLSQLQPVGMVEHRHYPRYSFPRTLEPVRGPEDFVAKAGSRRYPIGTAYVQGQVFTPAPGVVRSARETANTARLEVETAGRAFLYMSVTPHKYWTITLDGTEVDAIVTNVGYQGIVVPAAGRHVVEMRYRNPLIAVGAAMSIAALLALVFLVRLPGKRWPLIAGADGSDARRRDEAMR